MTRVVVRAAFLASLGGSALGGCTSSDRTAEADTIDGTPKGDGQSSVQLHLTPEQPVQRFEVRCNEWFNCKVSFRPDPAQPGTKYLVTSRSTGRQWRFVTLETTCLEDGRRVETWWTFPEGYAPPADLRCSDREVPTVSSTDPVDVFDFEASHDDPWDNIWFLIWIDWT